MWEEHPFDRFCRLVLAAIVLITGLTELYMWHYWQLSRLHTRHLWRRSRMQTMYLLWLAWWYVRRLWIEVKYTAIWLYAWLVS